MSLPITHMTLYKHGVGFFERRGKVDAEAVELSFRASEMNDILKSLTVIDWAGGQVLGVEYPTPQGREERLAGCSVSLADGRSLRDLLVALSGRRVRLILDQQQDASGLLLGLDEVAERQPLATSLVSVLSDEQDQVSTYSLGRVLGIQILDERGAKDLRFFLDVALGQEEAKQVQIRLTPGSHDLSVSYVAPAPTWRVSYRLATDASAHGRTTALLQGWGILDNRLEEDLEGVSVTLVAGMPVSFVYELYTPFTPDRPVVQEEARVAAAPVEFAEARGFAEAAPAPRAKAAEDRMDAAAMAGAPAPAGRFRQTVTREALHRLVPPAVTGRQLGELFQYVIATPVTVRRGNSAMVPIVSVELKAHKDLLYNGSKLPGHPVATLRLQNRTGLTLERGPVTVLENGEYVGEAIVPFTVAGGELAVPYAVELACRVREESGSARELRALQIRGIYLQIEEWEVRWQEYQLSSTAGQTLRVLVEHPRNGQYELFDTPAPIERTDEHLRFAVGVPARGEARLRVQERRVVYRREELRGQTPDTLQLFLRRGLLAESTHRQLVDLLQLWERMAAIQKQLEQLELDRQKIYRAQQQVQGNMGALSTSGKEGALRARYVEQLEAGENALQELGRQETGLKSELETLRAESEKRIRELGS